MIIIFLYIYYKAICISSDYRYSETCSSLDDTKFICTNYDKTCETEVNQCFPENPSNACKYKIN